jgi:pimeloyl-ACP methyl ester carboxylesterase
MAQWNSTIVRGLRRMEPALRRSTFAVLDQVAPEVSGRLATRLWFTLPPTVAWKEPRPGSTGRPFAVAVLGARLRGRRWGDHGRPVVYLVHGWGGSGAQLHAFVDPLVDAGFAVVSYDGLSHGSSDPGPLGPRSASALELTAALHAVADMHGPAAGIVAHSLGCTVAANAVLEGLPADRLVFLAPMANVLSFTDSFVRLLGAGERTRIRLIRNIEARVNRSMEEFTLYALAGPASHVPILLAHDGDDRDTPWMETKRLASALPRAELLVTKGLGHYRILRDPFVIRRSVDFLARTDMPVLEDRLVG